MHLLAVGTHGRTIAAQHLLDGHGIASVFPDDFLQPSAGVYRVCHLQGYLAALSASSYSNISMLQHFAPLMNEGGAAISLTYIASERIIPGIKCSGSRSPLHCN